MSPETLTPPQPKCLEVSCFITRFTGILPSVSVIVMLVLFLFLKTRWLELHLKELGLCLSNNVQDCMQTNNTIL